MASCMVYLPEAEREARQYEQYKQQNRPTSFSYVGTAGGFLAFSVNVVGVEMLL